MVPDTLTCAEQTSSPLTAMYVTIDRILLFNTSSAVEVLFGWLPDALKTHQMIMANKNRNTIYYSNWPHYKMNSMYLRRIHFS